MRKHSLLSLALVLFVCALPLRADVASADIHWTTAESPYVVTETIVITDGATFTIDPGVEVRFAPDVSLNIASGQLIARGTENDPILFTADDQDPWGRIAFGPGAVPATFDAGGNYTSGSILEYAIVERAGGTATPGAIHAYYSAPYVKSCVIRDNANTGIHGERCPEFRIEQNTITNNTGDDGGGLHLWSWSGDDNLFISGNDIYGNTATQSGGGVYIFGTGWFYFSNNIIRDNTAPDGGGVWMYRRCREITFAGDRIIGNTGAGVYITNAEDYVFLSIDPTEPTCISGNTGPYQVVNVAPWKAQGATGVIQAQDVCWGTTDEDEIAAIIFDYYDAEPETYGKLLWNPFAVPGDVNVGGAVDMLDLTILAGNWGQNPHGWSEGNFNADRIVNLLDLTILAGNWDAGASVPEPGALLLLAVGGLALLRRAAGRLSNGQG